MNQYSNMSVNMAEQEPITVVGVDLGKTWTEVCGQAVSGKAQNWE